MRWVSVAIIALLLANVQCLSACTLASCAPAPKDARLPPCHQHHQAPASSQHNNCDHQNAVNAPSADLALAHLGLAPAPFVMPVLIADAQVVMAGHIVLGSPPGLLASSVLRI